MRLLSKDNRRFFVPEVVQTSAMDCGPVALKCLLEGFGVHVSYGRLREACQTDVDGTSINTLEDVARQLGLDAVQVMLPKDHLLLPDSASLPAIVVIRLPNGLTHFVVAWRIHGPFIQIMDPGIGRRWLRTSRFLSELYVHEHPVPAQDWRDWAGSDEMIGPLRAQLLVTGMAEADCEELIRDALLDPDWHALASLDAAVRLTHSLLRSNGMEKGEEAAGILHTFYEAVREAHANGQPDLAVIPSPFWQVRPFDSPSGDAPEPGEECPPMLVLSGAVLVRVQGTLSAEAANQETESPGEGLEHDEGEAPRPLSPELAAALEEKPSKPEKELFRLLRKDEMLSPATVVLGFIMAAIGVTMEAMLFRGVLDIGLHLDKLYERWLALTALVVFLLCMLLLELGLAAATLRLGRRFETRLRVAFLEKIPRLGDRYLHSRLISDMTQRAHDLRELRTLPQLLSRMLMTFFSILLTVAGIILLIPKSALLAIAATIICIAATFAVQPLLIEKDLRVRTHIGALSRYYLDALLGLLPIRTHRAERAFRRGHESLLVEWARASQDYIKSATLLQGFLALVWTLFAIWLVNNYMNSGGEASGVLLLFYWALNLPVLGKALADMAQQYPLLRNRILRLLEPLNAPEESDFSELSGQAVPARASLQPTRISLQQVSVQAGGQTILENISCDIEPGEHLAIVGRSGAGKSSFVGLLLGWHRPLSGRLLVDGTPLSKDRLEQLRRHTAWVDPSVQLWNRSLLENLQYGSSDTASASVTAAIEQADLYAVLEHLPQGLKTSLGEGGGLVSGGEGQRVRLGRSLLRKEVTLAILDEPFRGLDRDKRRILLQSARSCWQDATLIFISHDIAETRDFDRVLVIDNGRIVENAAPDVLENNPKSLYSLLLREEERVRSGLWGSKEWKRFWLEGGRLKVRDENS